MTYHSAVEYWIGTGAQVACCMPTGFCLAKRLVVVKSSR